MRIIVLGLFNWKNKLWSRSDVKEIARIFLSLPVDKQVAPDENNWYSTETGTVCINGLTIGMKLTHSRVIAQYQLTSPSSKLTFEQLTEKRAEIKHCIDNYLSSKCAEISAVPALKKDFSSGLPKPFIFTYPLIILDEGMELNRLIEKKHDEDWKIPWDISTTCFFAGLPDTSRGGKTIYMRISGASLITASASNHFIQRLINLIYYSGLYKMTRDDQKLDPYGLASVTDYVYPYGLEPLLESQGQEIANVLTQRATEERLEDLNSKLTKLTIVVVGLTFLLALVEFLRALHLFGMS